jgi:hypothetical protein
MPDQLPLTLLAKSLTKEAAIQFIAESVSSPVLGDLDRRFIRAHMKSLNSIQSCGVLLVALMLLLMGCSSSSNNNSANSDPSSSGVLSGNWQMSLQPTNTKARPLGESGFLLQTNDSVTGGGIVSDNPCSGVGSVSGTVSGNAVSLTVNPTGLLMNLTGTLNSRARFRRHISPHRIP